VSTQWRGRREGGGRFAIWLIRTIGLHCGRRAARVLLYPITLYFYFRRGVERRGSYAYLGRVLGRPARMHEVLRHIHCFASTLLDRVFLLSDRFRRFDVRVEGLDQLTRHLDRDRGVLLLGAHIGSFEVLRALAGEHPDVAVHAVLDTVQTPALTELLHALNPEVAANVIDASRPSTEIVLAIREAIEAGGIATLLADRARPHESTVSVNFLGSPARFPVAPMLIAAALDAPVVLAFGLFRGGRRYDLYFEGFAEHVVLPRHARKEALHAEVQRFATRLEAHVRDAPYNWFNWHDIWNVESDAGESRVDRAAVSRRAA
jgi:predicted LPLAT superfamily acyltransferase